MGSKPRAGIVDVVQGKGGPDDSGLRALLEEFIEAVMNKDMDSAVAAFKAAHAECLYQMTDEKDPEQGE